MKIVFLLNEESNHSLKWIEYFKSNHEVNVLKMKKTSSKILDVLVNILPIRKQIQNIKPDIIHAHSAGAHGILAAMSGFHPFILTILGSDVLVFSKSLLARPFIKFALKKADLITCDGDNSKKTAIDLGAEPKKIKMINFGVDTQLFSPGGKNKELMNRLGISNSPVVISLKKIKQTCDISSLIRAAPLVLKEFPTAKFIIVGKNYQEEDLEKIAKSLGVRDSIRFTGLISNKELPSYLRLADIYVSASLRDAGISIGTAEAMACGLPVIVTDVADNRKWIKDGENGFIFTIKDPKSLAEKIVYLLKNKSFGKKFGEINRQIIEEKNNYYKEMAKMENIYKSFEKN